MNLSFGERLQMAFLNIPNLLTLVVIVFGLVAVARIRVNPLPAPVAHRGQRLALWAGVLGLASLVVDGGESFLRFEWTLRVQAEGYRRAVSDPGFMLGMLAGLKWVKWALRFGMLALLWWVIVRPHAASAGEAGAASTKSATMHADSLGEPVHVPVPALSRQRTPRVLPAVLVIAAIALAVVLPRYWLSEDPRSSREATESASSASGAASSTQGAYCSQPQRWLKDDSQRYVPCVRIGEVWRVEHRRTGDVALIEFTRIFDEGRRAEYRYRFRRADAKAVLQGSGEVREDYLRVPDWIRGSNEVIAKGRHDTTIRAESIRLGWSMGSAEFSYLYSSTARMRLTRVTVENAFERGFDAAATMAEPAAAEP